MLLKLPMAGCLALIIIVLSSKGNGWENILYLHNILNYLSNLKKYIQHSVGAG